MKILKFIAWTALGFLAGLQLGLAWYLYKNGEGWLALMFVGLAVLVLLPPRYDPAIRFNDWLYGKDRG